MGSAANRRATSLAARERQVVKLAVITHEFDDFVRWRVLPWPQRRSRYLLLDVLRHFESFGHSWRAIRGPRAVEAEAALLHVDSTIVDDDYLALASRYDRTFNFGTGDISKTSISSLRVTQGDDWHGPVVVKSNLNHRGILEHEHNSKAARAGRPLPHPGVQKAGEYQLLDRLEDVPDHVWLNQNLIVERFMPERDEDGQYVYRTWIFMGGRERCTRFVARNWMVKAGNITGYEPMKVPEQLRAERERLNFDFGKFDFVMHDGEPILLDVNRTPGVSKRIEPLMKGGARNLAEGLNELVTAPR